MTTALPPPQILADAPAIAAFEGEWRTFAESCANSPFETPDWLVPWYRHYAGHARPRILVWRVDGRLVGVLPLLVERTGRLVRVTQLSLWAGFGPLLRGLVDIVATDDARPLVLDSLAAWLREGPQSWDLLNLLRLPSGSSTAGRLRAEAGRGGWRTVSLSGVVHSTAYVIDLPAEPDGWTHLLGSKARHNLRTERNRFIEAGGTFEQSSDPAIAPEAVAVVRRLMTAHWGKAELDFAPDPSFEPFLVEAFTAMLANGSLYVDISRDRTGIRACLATSVLNKRAAALVIGVSQDADVRKLSLGKQVFYNSMGEAARRGCCTYDLLWAGRYKESFWHARPTMLESLVIGRGWRGGSIAEVVRLRRRVLPQLARREPHRVSPINIRRASGVDERAWNAFVAGQPESDILQTWTWGDVMGGAGERPERLIASAADGRIRGVAQALVRQTSFGQSVLYVPHGPIWDRSAADADAVLAELLEGLRGLAQEEHGIVVKLDPRADGATAEEREAIVARLLAAGLHPARHHLQAPTTRLVDLLDGGADLRNAWSKEARNLYRRSLKEGVVAEVQRQPDADSIRVFQEILEVTATRASFRCHDLAFFEELAAATAPVRGWYLCLARKDGRPIGGMLTLRLRARAYYLYGGSLREPELKNANAGYAMMGATMEALARDGVRVLDLWGVAEPDEEGPAEWAGFSAFKRRFNGTPSRHLGTFDLVVDPFWYAVRDVREELRSSG